ncbi:MAG: magnesium protoporphyrin IX methyltransferase [Marinovum sp.]|nr:magnesium protoporphyrin IX methyltransferase [Marinovum sp.]
MNYEATRSRVEHYFDRTATKTWERLTSDAPVSRIRETVRQGRDQMRDKMLERLPEDLTGRRVLDAGCGTGMVTEILAARGANVVAVDISPQLIDIARKRLPAALAPKVSFHAGDMMNMELGAFDHAVAMDSLIYYGASDIKKALTEIGSRTRENFVFTIAPRTPLLMVMWNAGKLFPRSDRSPIMVPHAPRALQRSLKGTGTLTDLGRVARGFYISQALEFRA